MGRIINFLHTFLKGFSESTDDLCKGLHFVHGCLIRYPLNQLAEAPYDLAINTFSSTFFLELSSNPSLASTLIPAHARNQAAASTPTNAPTASGENLLHTTHILGISLLPFQIFLVIMQTLHSQGKLLILI